MSRDQQIPEKVDVNFVQVEPVPPNSILQRKITDMKGIMPEMRDMRDTQFIREKIDQHRNKNTKKLDKLPFYTFTTDETKQNDNDAFNRSRSRSRIMQKKKCIIMPDNPRKANWDLFIVIVLFYTCMVTPTRLAFFEDDLGWMIVNNLINLLFLIDMIIIFNSALEDDFMNIIDDRKLIAIEYLRGWFIIDLLAIIPLDLIMSAQGGQNEQTDWNKFGRVARIGRMYKLIKLTRLFRILKIIKERSKIAKYLRDFLRISIGFERLFFFVLSFMMAVHIFTCLWVIIVDFSTDEEDLDKNRDVMETYWTALYFTITTITTVGYGDISGQNTIQRLYCVFLMLMGVIAFSYATSTLSQIMQNMDSENSKYREQVEILDSISKKCEIPPDLFTRIKTSMNIASDRDIEQIHNFMQELPAKLQIELSTRVYQKTYQRIPLFRDKSSSFIAWICPILKPFIVSDRQILYFDDDQVHNIFFHEQGDIGMILPRYKNAKYVNINEGSYFGVIDIIASVKNQGININEWSSFKDKLQRRTTVMAFKQTQLLSLSLVDFKRMQREFFETYEQLIQDVHQRLLKILHLKIISIHNCWQQMNTQQNGNIIGEDSHSIDIDGEIQYSIKCYNYVHLETISLEEIEQEYPDLQMFEYKSEDHKEIEDAKQLIDKLQADPNRLSQKLTRITSHGIHSKPTASNQDLIDAFTRIIDQKVGQLRDHVDAKMDQMQQEIRNINK